MTLLERKLEQIYMVMVLLYSKEVRTDRHSHDFVMLKWSVDIVLISLYTRKVREARHSHDFIYAKEVRTDKQSHDFIFLKKS